MGSALPLSMTFSTEGSVEDASRLACRAPRPKEFDRSRAGVDRDLTAPVSDRAFDMIPTHRTHLEREVQIDPSGTRLDVDARAGKNWDEAH